MPLFHIYSILFLVFISNVSCQKPMHEKQRTAFEYAPKIDGMTVVAPPDPFGEDPMPALKKINVDWVGVIPYAFTRIGEPTVQFGSKGWQWWGETPEGATETIKLGRQAGFKVMLKPQVYVPGSWTGAIDYGTEEEWTSWESDYKKYILTFAKIAEEQQVDLFCIGTEFKISAITRPAFWEELIKEIRSIYSGKLTYAANWDDYPQITWWDKLDYIGVDAYFPLSEESLPSVQSLVESWKPIAKQMQDFSAKFNKPILFTEFGYMSVAGCAGKTWELEKDRSILEYNEQAQADAFEALYQVFWSTSYWAGGFIWKWYPNEFARKDRMQKDYTPQNKLGEATLSKWYAKE